MQLLSFLVKHSELWWAVKISWFILKKQQKEMDDLFRSCARLPVPCCRFGAELQRQAAHTSAKIETCQLCCTRADKSICCNFGMSHYKHPSGHDLPLILDQVTGEKADGATEPHHLQTVDRQTWDSQNGASSFESGPFRTKLRKKETLGENWNL